MGSCIYAYSVNSITSKLSSLPIRKHENYVKFIQNLLAHVSHAHEYCSMAFWLASLLISIPFPPITSFISNSHYFLSHSAGFRSLSMNNFSHVPPSPHSLWCVDFSGPYKKDVITLSDNTLKAMHSL